MAAAPRLLYARKVLPSPVPQVFSPCYSFPLPFISRDNICLSPLFHKRSVEILFVVPCAYCSGQIGEPLLSRDNLDENGGGNQSLKRRPVARS